MKSLMSAAAALLLAAAPLHAADHTLDVGGTAVVVPVDDAYLAVRREAADLIPFTESALPPSTRLVEMFHTPANVARIRNGEIAAGLFMQVQAIRQLEPMTVTDADWKALVPQFTAGMENARIDDSAEEAAARDERMAAATGRDMSIRFDQSVKPQIYLADDNSVRFFMRLPITIQADTPDGPASMQVELAVASGFLRVRGKLMQVNWYAVPGTAESQDAARRQLDATIAQIMEANRR